MSRDINKNYSILMIGNSFSYYNNMNAADGILYRVATEEGYNVSITPVYQGGYYLHKFLDPSDPFGAQVKEKLENNRYDMIVIQEQSNFAIRDPEAFLDSCKRFKEKADENGAELCLYATWGYKDGCSKLETFGPSSADMGMKLRRAYTDAAEKLGTNIAQVGTAFIEIGDKLELYDADKQHPGLLGSTLAAYTICGSLFGIDPKELKYTGDLDKETAELLKAAASNAKTKNNKTHMKYLTNIHRIGKIKTGDDEKLWLTKKFTLDTCPEMAIIRADSQGVCGIYVNGEFIDASSGRYCNRITCFEVTSRLHTGENEIGLALGGFFYDSKGKQMYARRGFHFAAAALELELISGERRKTVTTDRSWICESDEGRENADSFSCVTVAEYDRFWRAAALWNEQKQIDVPKAILDTVGDAYREYTENALPKFMYPEKIIEKTENSIVYDFGRLYVGYPTIEYESETDGSVTLKFDYFESADDFNEDSKFFGSSKGLNITEKIKKGKHTLTVHNRRASRFVKLIFDAEVKDFSYSYRLSMMPYDKLGWFECNEPVFNKMWEVGKYTLHVNKHREYESCPRNEMKYFSGDGIIAALIDYYAFGDAPLVDASLSLTEIACNGGICNDIYERNMPLWDYPAWRIITAYNHYRYTNDKDFVKRYYAELKRNTEWMINKMNDRCLIYQYPLYWAPFYRNSEAVEWTCSTDRLGEKPSLNSLFYKSLICMSELAEIADDMDGEEYGALAEKVKNAINEYLWNDEKGAYLESCDRSYIPQDGNALAVLFGIADEKRAKTLYETLCRENWSSCGSSILSKDTGNDEHTRGGSRTVSPVSCMYEAEGRFISGDAKGALELMRRVWGTMLKKGAETFWEFCPNDENKRWPLPSHAWSGGCTYLLSAYVLGIRPTAPGYEKMLFSPCAELDSFRGVVPTVKGLVAVSCDTVDGKKQYTLTVPKQTEIEIKIPETATVTVNEY